MLKNFWRKNWKRRFQEFLKITFWKDPDFWPPSSPLLIHYWHMARFAWSESMVNGYSFFALTKSPFVVARDPEDLVCDPYYNPDA